MYHFPSDTCEQVRGDMGGAANFLGSGGSLPLPPLGETL